MARDESRTIRVRCVTWDQVEQFYAQKLRGDALVVKMPVRPELGEGVTVALGLPSGLVFALDGSVAQVGSQDTTGKWPVSMRMHGLSREVRDRLARLVTDGRAGLLSAPAIAPPAPPGGTTTGSPRRPRTEPPAADGSELVIPPMIPRVDDVAPDERAVFGALVELDRKLRERPAHEVLGVPVDADLRTIRAAYFKLAKQHHPDAYARHRSPAVHLQAQELFIFVNRAYDRLRESSLRQTGVSVPGPAMSGGPGWWLDPRDAEPVGESEPGEVAVELVVDNPGEPAADISGDHGRRDLADELFGDLGPHDEAPPFDTPVPASTERALSLANAGRASLAAGRFDEARGSFAAAHKLDGKNREVRARYIVASGLLLRARGQHAEAQVQLETALGHDPNCGEAQRALGRVKRE
jgi:DnaJ-domain-containing protein 1